MSSLKPILHFLSNILLVYLLYMVCRVIYILEFWDLYASSWDQLSLSRLLAGSLRFDTSAIIYTNILYALLVLPPTPAAGSPAAPGNSSPKPSSWWSTP